MDILTSAGMAACGMRPVVALYSTFLQRSYDQVLHDVCLQKLPVVFAIDRAGLIGEDGETHQGLYDAAFLSTMPNMTIYSPATQQELVHMLSYAIGRGEPAAIRYNRGCLMQAVSSVPVERGVWEVLEPIARRTIVATGNMVALALPVARRLGAGLVNARTIKPLDEALLVRIRGEAERVVVLEDGVDCLGLQISAKIAPVTVVRMCAPDEPVCHASVSQQRVRCGFTEEALCKNLLGDEA